MSSPPSWRDEPKPPPLRPQRGGSPIPSETRYRTKDVDRLWEQLGAGESILLTAKKRVGKTAVLGLLQERGSEQLLVVKRDVESVGTPKQLMELLCSDVMPLLPPTERAKKRLGQFVTTLGGSSVGPVTLPQLDHKDWQSHLNELFDALAEHLENAELQVHDVTMITGDYPNMDWDDAYAIQDEIKRRKEGRRCELPPQWQ